MKEKIYLPDGLCVPGIQPVYQVLLEKSQEIEVIFIKNRDAEKNPRIQYIVDVAKQHGIPISVASDSEPFPMDHSHHQGVLAILKNSFNPTLSEEDLFALYQHAPPPLMLALDKITDPHNLGAISRSSVFFGYSHMLLEHKYAPPIGSTVHKTSSGASISMNYFVVSSLQSVLRTLSGLGKIVVASPPTENSIPLHGWKPHNPTILVLGSEGFGVREVISKISSQKVHISGTPHMDSLNVSVCAGIFLQKCYSMHK